MQAPEPGLQRYGVVAAWVCATRVAGDRETLFGAALPLAVRAWAVGAMAEGVCTGGGVLVQLLSATTVSAINAVQRRS